MGDLSERTRVLVVASRGVRSNLIGKSGTILKVYTPPSDKHSGYFSVQLDGQQEMVGLFGNEIQQIHPLVDYWEQSVHTRRGDETRPGELHPGKEYVERIKA